MSLAIAAIPSININERLLTVKELLNVVHYDFNELYVDKFWDNIENDKWIYIGDHMLEWTGYQSEGEYNPKKWYVNLIIRHFTEKQDYVYLNASDAKQFYSHSPLPIDLPSDFNNHNKAKHLIVAPDCFKESLMLIETAKAKEIRKYYIQLEKIFKFYIQYQAKYQELKSLVTSKQLEEEKRKNTNLTNNAIDYNQLQKREYLYIATNARYASQNNFKLGKTLDLKQRLSAYNTSHNKHEPYYYTFVSEPTYNAKSIEYTIKHILTKFRNSDTNELYVVHYDFLEKIVKRICKNYNDSIDYYNECIQGEMENMSKVSVVPKDIWNVNVVEREIVKEVEFDNKLVPVEYFNNDKEYEFIRFQTKDKNWNFRCNRCEYVFNRLDQIQAHFRRKIKCFDNSKNEHISTIKENSSTPNMKHYRDNSEYSYYESFCEELQTVKYHCNRCEYATTNLPSMKKHFDRKKKCYDVKIVSNDSITIELLNDNSNHAYYRTIEAGFIQYNCNHCEYYSTELGNLSRHFKRKKNCWSSVTPQTRPS